jgi:hypothetical protein
MKAKRAKKHGAKQGAAIFNRRQSHDRAAARSTQMGHKRHSANGDATAIENRRSLKYSRLTFERLRRQGTLAVGHPRTKRRFAISLKTWEDAL